MPTALPSAVSPGWFFNTASETVPISRRVFCWHAHKRCGEIKAICRELGLLDLEQCSSRSAAAARSIAAERNGRRCRAIEISALYVDVAIRRWQKATGNEATLESNTFAEVAAERGLA